MSYPLFSATSIPLPLPSMSARSNSSGPRSRSYSKLTTFERNACHQAYAQAQQKASSGSDNGLLFTEQKRKLGELFKASPPNSHKPKLGALLKANTLAKEKLKLGEITKPGAPIDSEPRIGEFAQALIKKPELCSAISSSFTRFKVNDDWYTCEYDKVLAGEEDCSQLILPPPTSVQVLKTPQLVSRIAYFPEASQRNENVTQARQSHPRLLQKKGYHPPGLYRSEAFYGALPFQNTLSSGGELINHLVAATPKYSANDHNSDELEEYLTVSSASSSSSFETMSTTDVDQGTEISAFSSAKSSHGQDPKRGTTDIETSLDRALKLSEQLLLASAQTPSSSREARERSTSADMSWETLSTRSSSIETSLCFSPSPSLPPTLNTTRGNSNSSLSPPPSITEETSGLFSKLKRKLVITTSTIFSCLGCLSGLSSVDPEDMVGQFDKDLETEPLLSPSQPSTTPTNCYGSTEYLEAQYRRLDSSQGCGSRYQAQYTTISTTGGARDGDNGSPSESSEEISYFSFSDAGLSGVECDEDDIEKTDEWMLCCGWW